MNDQEAAVEGSRPARPTERKNSHFTTNSTLQQRDMNDLPREVPHGPIIPLSAAAQQMHDAVTRAIEYFNRFYKEYVVSIKDIRAHVKPEILNSIWHSKICSSVVTPGPNGFSFYEHHNRVISCIEMLLRSRTPILQTAAAHAARTPMEANSNYLDDDLRQYRERYHAATLLKLKAGKSYTDLKKTLRGMGHDSNATRLAIVELRQLKVNLEANKRCWDDEWYSEEDDLSENNPGGRDGRGNRQYGYGAQEGPPDEAGFAPV